MKSTLKKMMSVLLAVVVCCVFSVSVYANDECFHQYQIVGSTYEMITHKYSTVEHCAIMTVFFPAAYCTYCGVEQPPVEIGSYEVDHEFEISGSAPLPDGRVEVTSTCIYCSLEETRSYYPNSLEHLDH